MNRIRRIIENKKTLYILITVFLLVLSGIGFGVRHYKKLKNPQDLFTPKDQANKNNDLDIDIVDQFDKNVVNILIVGFDRDEGRSKEESAFRTDTNLVVSMNLEKNTADILSIPRDSYVPIAHMNGRKDKFNSSFVYGFIYGENGEKNANGYKYLLDTTKDLLGGIPLDYYLGVDMDVVKEIVDALGGIEIDVPRDVVKHKVVRIKKGKQKLDGDTLMFYARFRDLPEGDIARVRNQQEIIKAIFTTLKESNKFSSLPKIYKSVMDNVETNMNLNQLTALALFGKDLDKNNMNMHMMKGEFGHFNNLAYWIINQNARVELVKELYGIEIRPSIQDPTSETVQHFEANIGKREFEIGETARITARGATNITASKQFSSRDMIFSSSNQNVAIITGDGLVKAVGAGQATIVVSIGGVSRSINIMVNKPIIDENPEGKDPEGNKPEGNKPEEPISPEEPKDNEGNSGEEKPKDDEGNNSQESPKDNDINSSESLEGNSE